jgi:hypothetical protein
MKKIPNDMYRLQEKKSQKGVNQIDHPGSRVIGRIRALTIQIGPQMGANPTPDKVRLNIRPQSEEIRYCQQKSACRPDNY